MNPRWPAGDPRDVVHAILRGPEYRSPGIARSDADLLDLVLKWFGSLLHRMFGGLAYRVDRDEHFVTVVGSIVLAAIVAALIAIVFRVVRLWVDAHPRARRLQRAGSTAVLTSGDWYTLAIAHDAAHRWHEAATALVHAALCVLDETDRLAYDRARTPAELQRALPEPAITRFVGDAQLALFAAGGADATRIDRMRAAYLELAHA